MRVFYAFLVMFTAALLWMIPLTTAIYDFRTDVRENNFTVDTAVLQTTDNVTLTEELYDDDTSSVDFLSSLETDNATASSYNGTSRQLLVAGLSVNTTRTLTVFFDVDALVGNDAINTVLDIVPYIWILCLVAFPMAAIAAIFMGKAG